VKHKKYQSLWLFAAILLVVVLAGCGSAATESPTPTPTIDPAELLSEETSSSEPTTAPTAEPIVLKDAIVTDSGLQYLELIAGDGAAPQSGDLITMHYVASLPDGTELISTYSQGQPVTVLWDRDQLLPGWEEGIGLMRVGGSAKLVLPPELAFGESGAGMVPPNTQLIIDIELLAAEQPPVPSDVSATDLIETDSGLQYADLVEGDGDLAVEQNTVTMAYTVWVQGEDEDLYIVSSEGGDPISFVLGRGDTVFPGWEEGATGMRVGGKRLLIIPPDLALGEQGSGLIPPNSTLIMEVELIDSIEPRKAMEIDEEDYTVTDSGLKYYDIVEGDGDTPTTGQTVVVHYTGWLEDGTQFDSSVDRGQPFSFQLGTGSVIAGWDEGISTMKVGGKRQLVIPSELGYGDTGSGGLIPPGATLIFEVELLEIQQ